VTVGIATWASNEMAGHVVDWALANFATVLFNSRGAAARWTAGSLPARCTHAVCAVMGHALDASCTDASTVPLSNQEISSPRWLNVLDVGCGALF